MSWSASRVYRNSTDFYLTNDYEDRATRFDWGNGPGHDPRHGGA